MSCPANAAFGSLEVQCGSVKSPVLATSQVAHWDLTISSGTMRVACGDRNSAAAKNGGPEADPPSGARDAGPHEPGHAWYWRMACSSHRCISNNFPMVGIMWLRFAMMIIEPKTVKPTTKTPKASARTLFVWSGALDMWRKKIK